MLLESDWRFWNWTTRCVLLFGMQRRFRGLFRGDFCCSKVEIRYPLDCVPSFFRSGGGSTSSPGPLPLGIPLGIPLGFFWRFLQVRFRIHSESWTVFRRVVWSCLDYPWESPLVSPLGWVWDFDVWRWDSDHCSCARLKGLWGTRVEFWGESRGESRGSTICGRQRRFNEPNRTTSGGRPRFGSSLLIFLGFSSFFFVPFSSFLFFFISSLRASLLLFAGWMSPFLFLSLVRRKENGFFFCACVCLCVTEFQLFFLPSF